jgi:hypothetical protein
MANEPNFLAKVWAEKKFITAAAWASMCVLIASEAGNKDAAVALMYGASFVLGAWLLSESMGKR